MAQRTGNTPPVIIAPSPEQQAKLKEMDERIAAAEKQLAALRPEIENVPRQ